MILDSSDTICALSTPNGMGAIAVIRISGSDAFSIVSSVFSKDISNKSSHTAHFGIIKKGKSTLVKFFCIQLKAKDNKRPQTDVWTPLP